jgi:predicted CoA-binding protein
MLEYPDALFEKIFAETKIIAVVGASPKPERPSHGVMRFLQSRGYRCIPVNPGQAGGAINGETVYTKLADIPLKIDMVDVFRRSDHAGAVVDEAIAIGAKTVWMQLGVRDDAAAARGQKAGLAVIMDHCPAIELPRLEAKRARAR